MKAVATLLSGIELPSDVTLNDRELCDLEMLLMGAFAPLQGYLDCQDFCSVVERGRLKDGTVWPIPIALPIPKNHVVQSENPVGHDGGGGGTTVIKLRDLVGTILAEVHVTDHYDVDLDLFAKGVLGSADPNHPYVKYLRALPPLVYVGGHVRAVHPIHHFDFRDLRKTPLQVKKMIQDKGWKVVVGFQTRNPMHRSHFELTRQALKQASQASGGEPAHLLLTPACGPTQPEDIEYHVRVRCYKKILPFYKTLLQQEAELVLLPLAMRMAGPREAVWHALIRKNFGCTHFIVGRDHAGPSTKKTDGTSFYGPYEAHALLKSLEHEIGIIPLFGRNLVYLGDDHGGFVPEDQIPPNAEALQISGTKFRQMLVDRTPVPEWYSFAPVVTELQSYFKKRQDLGFCLYFTGLPCSGKTTLATAVQAALLERDNERRHVTLLDADVIRTHLSRGLGYDREGRQINVRRIGYVASLVVQHGGICVVANIAPYEEDRMFNRQTIAATGGGYIEVYVSTPLEVCERRDVKELYKKARLGIVQQFTGISDPYEVPSQPELAVDSSEDILGKVTVVMRYLADHGWIV